jgi:putative hemolysin
LDDPGPSLILISIFLCLLTLGFISAVDSAFTATGRHRLNALLENRRSSTKRAIAQLIEDPSHFKSTIIFLHTCVTLIAAGLTFRLSGNIGSQIINLLLLAIAILITSEVIPKAIVSRNPNATVLALARPLSIISQLLWPIIMLINLITRPLFAAISGKSSHRSPLVIEEELRLLVNAGEEEGVIEHEEREMIEGVMTFGDTLVREIMIPRADIIAMEKEATLDQALDIVVARGHSRIPVYDEMLDNIVGILYAKDLIPALRNCSGDIPISGLLRKGHFVPETMKVNVLLEYLQQSRVHMAIMVDEYGGVAGLATIEDLIEQIVGEIQDEYDTEDPSVQPIGEGDYIVDARVVIDDINNLIGLHLPDDTSDRMGGLVYDLLGRVPRVGDELVCDGAFIRILSVKGVRAQKLRVTRRTAESKRLELENHIDEEERYGSSGIRRTG